MRVVLDLNICQGYANCVAETPDLFDFDDEMGKAVVLRAEFDAALADEARRAVDNCPVTAIAIVD